MEARPTGGPPDRNGEMGYPYIKSSPLPRRAEPEVARVFESSGLIDILRGSTLRVTFLPGPCQARAQGGENPFAGGCSPNDLPWTILKRAAFSGAERRLDIVDAGRQMLVV